MSSYIDPTFREMHREMFRVTQAAIIEWLKRRGMFVMPPFNRRKTIQRLIRENVFVVLAVIFGIGLTVGWLVRTFWYS